MPTELKQLNETAPDTGGTNRLTVDLWTRRPVCGPRVTVIDRLSSLRAAGTLADFSVATWPDEIVISDRNRHSELLGTIEEFEAWAADNGVSLRPPFETRTASLLVGRSKEVLTTPMLLASLYDGDDVVGVYPCTDGEHNWTVPEFLDALEAEGTVSGAGKAVALPMTDPEST
ncbi:HTH domain-containing protein [Haloarcula pellucida]|uniref:Uncharacterized protein n=1 Tax=Haloarcula pellucida TaxID=1427151 RepID=A0A830GEV5_9EURY|nr:HTH domain-containing protein [Halomicroarcula pellucida]MBX0346619.1 hypothetical protein [Halomicroarcula pellucida]GGN84588.1 hypothetical protein GCM10009030_00370 [Halomicroarcula pellucida]